MTKWQILRYLLGPGFISIILVAIITGVIPELFHEESLADEYEDRLALRDAIKDEYDNLPNGHLELYCPDKMYVDGVEIVRLRISKNNSNNLFVDSESCDIVREDLPKISRVMESNLVAHKFIITEITPVRQSTDDEVEWCWYVIPTEPGIHRLAIGVNLLTELPHSEEDKLSAIVLDKVIYVENQNNHSSYNGLCIYDVIFDDSEPGKNISVNCINPDYEPNLEIDSSDNCESCIGNKSLTHSDNGVNVTFGRCPKDRGVAMNVVDHPIVTMSKVGNASVIAFAERQNDINNCITVSDNIQAISEDIKIEYSIAYPKEDFYIKKPYISMLDGTLNFSSPSYAYVGRGNIVEARVAIISGEDGPKDILNYIEIPRINLQLTGSELAIENLTPETQPIVSNDTVWKWYVVPKETGSYKFELNMDLIDNTEKSKKNIKVVSKTINVV